MQIDQGCFGMPGVGVGSTVTLNTPSGLGSANAYNRYFTNISKQVGVSLIPISDVSLGSRILVKDSGVYSFVFANDHHTSLALDPAVVVNSPGLSPASGFNVLATTRSVAGQLCTVGWVGWFNSGDLVYAQFVSTNTPNNDAPNVSFTGVRLV